MEDSLSTRRGFFRAMVHASWKIGVAGLLLIVAARPAAAETARASAQVLIIVPERPAPQARLLDPQADPQAIAQSLVPPATAEVVREGDQTVIRYTRVSF